MKKDMPKNLVLKEEYYFYFQHNKCFVAYGYERGEFDDFDGMKIIYYLLDKYSKFKKKIDTYKKEDDDTKKNEDDIKKKFDRASGIDIATYLTKASVQEQLIREDIGKDTEQLKVEAKKIREKIRIAKLSEKKQFVPLEYEDQQGKENIELLETELEFIENLILKETSPDGNPKLKTAETKAKKNFSKNLNDAYDKLVDQCPKFYGHLKDNKLKRQGGGFYYWPGLDSQIDWQLDLPSN